VTQYIVLVLLFISNFTPIKPNCFFSRDKPSMHIVKKCCLMGVGGFKEMALE